MAPEKGHNGITAQMKLGKMQQYTRCIVIFSNYEQLLLCQASTLLPRT